MEGIVKGAAIGEMSFVRQLVTACGLGLMASLPTQALAQACEGIPGLTINGDFEEPDITTTPPFPQQSYGSNPYARLYNEADIVGWSTTASDGRIEIWSSGFGGVTSYDGNQHAEVNASQVGALFQNITTIPGSTIIWRFAHRGRAGVDTVTVELGPPSGPLTTEGTFSTGNSAWAVYEGIYVVPAGQTTTRFQFRAVSTASSATVGNFVDGIIIAPFCDYGDAPAIYPVLRSNNGAAHQITSAGFLGSAIDADADGLPSSDATGDDNDNDADNGDDEDGVSFGLNGNGEIIRSGLTNLSITASAAGYVNVWLDFDQDGIWSNAERILDDEPVVAGTQNFQFTVPGSAAIGATFARIRYTIDNPLGGLGPGGDWINGEVEDEQLLVIDDAALQIVKSSQSFLDTGVGDGTDLRLPGNDVLYTVQVANVGIGSPDTDSIFVVDELPSDLTFFNGDANGTGAGVDRVIFTDNGSGLTFDPVADVAFASGPAAPENFAQCTLPGAAGYDPNIRYICFNPKGVMAFGSPAPSFQLQFRTRIE